MSDPEIEMRLNELEARWKGDRSSRLFLQLAEEMRRAGRLSDATRVLEEGLRAHPEAISALVALGRCQLDAAEPEKAIETLEKAVSRDPSQLVANKLLVDALIRTGDAEGAEQRLAIYRLINDHDAEILELESRIARLHARGGGGGDSEVARPERPQRAPDPRTSRVVKATGRGDREPFATLSTPPGGGARILKFLAREGIFPEVPIGSPSLRPVASHSVPPSDRTPAFDPTPSGESEPTFSMRYIGAEVEREASAGGGDSEAGQAVRAPAAYPARESDEDAILEPHGSATLAALYLRQGHLDEAEQQYRAVLRAKPGDAAAEAGLEEVARRRAGAGEKAAPREVGLTERKVVLLRGLLGRIQRFRMRAKHVS